MSTQWKPALPGQLAEQRARAAVAAAPSQNLQLLFSGAELVLNYDRAKEYRAKATQDLREAATIGKDALADKLGPMVPNPKQMLVDYIRDAIPGIEDVEQIIEQPSPTSSASWRARCRISARACRWRAAAPTW